tara:strand:+ start:1094 stop:1657 length:564 start_codon:yes stop_codon:yes gene_type:complete
MGYTTTNIEEAEMSTNNSFTQLISTHKDDAFRFVLPFKVREQHKEWFSFYGRINEERDTYIIWDSEDFKERYDGDTRTLTPELVAEEAFLDELYREVGNFEYGDKAEMSRHIWKGDPACDAVRNELNRLLRFIEKLNNTYKEKGEQLIMDSPRDEIGGEPVYTFVIRNADGGYIPDITLFRQQREVQ